MSFSITFLLLFVVVGIGDKILGGRLDLGEEVDKGLTLMGSLSLSMSGIYCFSVLLGQWFAGFLSAHQINFFIDPSVLSSSLLSTSMGAYPISAQISSSHDLVLFSGVFLSSMLGTTISFSLPAALSSVSSKNLPTLMNGIIYGILTIVPALIAGGLFIGMPLQLMVVNLLPVILICLLLCIGILKAKTFTLRLFTRLGRGISALCALLFLGVVAQTFFMELTLIPFNLISDITILVFKTAVTICGSFVLSKLVIRYLQRPISACSRLLGINQVAVVGLFLNLVTSVSMFAVFDQMDRRGQMMNAACAVTAAYVLGGHLAFVAQVEAASIGVFMAVKFLGGLFSILLTCVLCPKEDGRAAA